MDLIYYPDDHPGITRRRAGRGWSYRGPDGTRIDDRAERRRLDAMAVPPAYTSVWMCPRPDGHLQATGRDARSRKQYRYHADWTAFRARRKYDDLPAFGAALPRIRRHIRAGLGGEAGERDFAIAAVLAMIDRLSMRVGHPDYAAANGTYGATTLRGRHLSFGPDGLRLSYAAKGGQRVRRRVRDRTLARALHRLDDLPGAALATWIDAQGRTREVMADDVNRRLEDYADVEGLTAKTFRTWNGSAAAMDVALKADDLTIKAMSEAAAERLANTPSIARNSYIHPRVIDLAGWDADARRALRGSTPGRRGLRAAEQALLGLLTS